MLLSPDLPRHQVHVNIVVREVEDPTQLVPLTVLGVVLLEVNRIDGVSVGHDGVDAGRAGYRSPGGVGPPLGWLLVQAGDEAAVSDAGHDLAAVDAVRSPDGLAGPDSSSGVAPHVAVPRPDNGDE